jgi:hypothetical protein
VLEDFLDLCAAFGRERHRAHDSGIFRDPRSASAW